MYTRVARGSAALNGTLVMDCGGLARLCAFVRLRGSLRVVTQENAVLVLEVLLHITILQNGRTVPEIVSDLALAPSGVCCEKVPDERGGIGGAEIAPVPGTAGRACLLERLREELVHGRQDGFGGLHGVAGHVSVALLEAEVEGCGETGPLLREGGLVLTVGRKGQVGAIGLGIGGRGARGG